MGERVPDSEKIEWLVAERDRLEVKLTAAEQYARDLRDERGRYREALEFYGEDSNWTFNELTESNRDECSLVDRDLGALARQALSDPNKERDA